MFDYEKLERVTNRKEVIFRVWNCKTNAGMIAYDELDLEQILKTWVRELGSLDDVKVFEVEVVRTLGEEFDVKAFAKNKYRYTAEQSRKYV